MSVYEDAWESLEEYYKKYLGERRVFIAYEVICKMQDCLTEARQRAKECQKAIEKGLDMAEEELQTRWKGEQAMAGDPMRDAIADRRDLEAREIK